MHELTQMPELFPAIGEHMIAMSGEDRYGMAYLEVTDSEGKNDGWVRVQRDLQSSAPRDKRGNAIPVDSWTCWRVVRCDHEKQVLLGSRCTCVNADELGRSVMEYGSTSLFEWKHDLGLDLPKE